MRALVFDKFGGPEVYRIADVPVPEPSEGQVQVKVDGAGFNPADWKIRENLFPSPVKFPMIAMQEFSGVVSKLGPGTTAYKVGDEVYGMASKGAAAEYAVAGVGAIGIRPASMDAADAALVPVAGMTAWQALFDFGHLARGQRVLITSASGGVGTFAVQLAKWKGAYVIGVSSVKNHSLLRELGADELIDYHDTKVEDVVHDVDLVVHMTSPKEFGSSFAVLKKGGRLVSLIGAPDEGEAKTRGVTAIGMSMKPSTAMLNELSALIEDLKVRPVIDTVVPLEKAAQAMAELQEGHTVGKMGCRIH